MKMRDHDWDLVYPYFGPAEFIYPYQMERDVVMLLCAMRIAADKPFFVHSSYRPGDPNQHGLGRAIDGHFVGMGVIEQYLFASEWNPPGLGFYPSWNSPGIHIDVRPIGQNLKGARWWRDRDGIYKAVTLDAIKQFI